MNMFSCFPNYQIYFCRCFCRPVRDDFICLLIIRKCFIHFQSMHHCFSDDGAKCVLIHPFYQQSADGAWTSIPLLKLRWCEDIDSYPNKFVFFVLFDETSAHFFCTDQDIIWPLQCNVRCLFQYGFKHFHQCVPYLEREKKMDSFGDH